MKVGVRSHLDILGRLGIGRPRALSRDHLFSVADGFHGLVDPTLLAHPANCRIILQRENMSKKHKSSISLDGLLARIERWEERYGQQADSGWPRRSVKPESL